MTETPANAAAAPATDKPRLWRLVEKLQFQVAAILGLALTAALAWPLAAPDSPDRAATYLFRGDWARLAAVAATLLVWSAAAAVLTVSTRRGAALAAAMIGLGGLCVRSDSLQKLLMTHPRQDARVLLALAGELLVLAGAALAASLIVEAVRQAMRKFAPSAVHPVSRAEVVTAAANGAKTSLPRGPGLVPALLGGATTLAAGFVLLRVLMFEPSRGQTLFALSASFLLAGMLGQWLFRATNPTFFWAAPVLLGVVMYVVGANAAPDPLLWKHLWPMAQALPIDWIAAGGGAALAGYWGADRLIEAHELGDG